MAPNLLLALILLVSSTSSTRNQPSDSILDIINTKEVERLLQASKKYNQNEENDNKDSKRYLLENELIENDISPEDDFDLQKVKLLEENPSRFDNINNPRVDIGVFLKRNNFSEPYRNTDLVQDLRGFNGRKLLKSSKNALFVTKKEYLQRDWCKTEPLIQKIKEEGCLTRTVINRFCYGQCNSFYIPKNPKRKSRRIVSEEVEDEDLNGPAFKACGFCRPSKFTWVTITLKCPSLSPQYRKKRVQRIKQCKCTAANIN